MFADTLDFLTYFTKFYAVKITPFIIILMYIIFLNRKKILSNIIYAIISILIYIYGFIVSFYAGITAIGWFITLIIQYKLYNYFKPHIKNVNLNNRPVPK